MISMTADKLSCASHAMSPDRMATREKRTACYVSRLCLTVTGFTVVLCRVHIATEGSVDFKLGEWFLIS
jgi:hypothetical protein